MTISYIEGDDAINSSSKIKIKENNLNIQYNSDFISDSKIDLNSNNYSTFIYESKIIIWYNKEKKGIIVEAEDIIFHAISSSDNNAEREGNYPYLYIQISVNEASVENLKSIQFKEFEIFKNALDSIELYIISTEYRKLENLYNEIANLLDNYDNKVNNINKNEGEDIEEDEYNTNDEKFENGFNDALVQLSCDKSLNSNEWYFGDVPFENIQLTNEGQAISERLEKMLEENNTTFDTQNYNSINIEKRELESEDGQFDNAEE
ncbi:hypothetical protein U3516DRAFT_592861 [Neocallimastix sp. 'constans']|jgi:hypothetical protein